MCVCNFQYLCVCNTMGNGMNNREYAIRYLINILSWKESLRQLCFAEGHLQWNILTLFYNFQVLLIFPIMTDERMDTSLCCTHCYPAIFINGSNFFHFNFFYSYSIFPPRIIYFLVLWLALLPVLEKTLCCLVASLNESSLRTTEEKSIKADYIHVCEQSE